MSGTLSRADLVADLKGSLHDAASVFTAAADGDFSRFLDAAALDLSRYRPLTLVGNLTLSAGVDEYAAPSDLMDITAPLWGLGQSAPAFWDDAWPGRPPRVSTAGRPGARVLVFAPAPTGRQIGAWGAAYKFFYRAVHSIGAAAAETTVAPADRGLLLLRAQAEALREMSIRNSGKPVQMRDGATGTPRNGTPAALYQALMDEFERRAG